MTERDQDDIEEKERKKAIGMTEYAMYDWMEKETSKWPYDGDCISKQTNIILGVNCLMKLWRVRSTSDAQYVLPNNVPLKTGDDLSTGPTLFSNDPHTYRIVEASLNRLNPSQKKKKEGKKVL